MKLEQEIFKNATYDTEKLLEYGFHKKQNSYCYSKEILNHAFRCEICITKENISGKIIDLAFDAEYTAFRIEKNIGKFASSVKEEYTSLLMDIKKKCFHRNYFLSNQANRIAEFIKKQFHVTPEFLWNNYPGYGVFRHPNNEKWFGIIMNIKNEKVTKIKQEIEILNVKIDEMKINELKKHKGFLEAYHMNKRNWISIILNDTISDDEIMNYVTESYHEINKPDSWIVPANPKVYDIPNHFKTSNTIEWKKTKDMKIGDYVYIYMTLSYQEILYQCQITNISENIEMKLMTTYQEKKYNIELLKKYGINSVRGPRKITKELKELLEKKSK